MRESFISWCCMSDPVFNEQGEEIETHDYVLIEKLYITPSERGQGKGRALLLKTIEEIKAEHKGLTIKIAALPFDCSPLDMEQLTAFYETVGFTITGTAGDAVIMEL